METIIIENNATKVIKKDEFKNNNSIEKVIIKKGIKTINRNAFANCTNLKEVVLPNSVLTIEDYAFDGCLNLEKINIPENVYYIGKAAFRNCKSIKEINIPKKVSFIEDETFAYMDSLEKITVSPKNEDLISFEDKLLINTFTQKVLLYAIGRKDKSLSLMDYIASESNGIPLWKPLTKIDRYAFAGSKNLEELTICACTTDIESTAFKNTVNLNKLIIESTDFFTCPYVKITVGDYPLLYHPTNIKEIIPFEEVAFTGDIELIFPEALSDFYNVKKINFSTDKKFDIGSNAFADCYKLEEVFIPNNVKEIHKYAFPENTLVRCENGIEIKGLIGKIKSEDKHYAFLPNNKKYYVYEAKDGTYFIESEDKIETISKSFIDKWCTNPQYIHKDPVSFLNYVKELKENDLNIKDLYDGLLISVMNYENRKMLFKSLKEDEKSLIQVIKNSDILKKFDIYAEHFLACEGFSKLIEYNEIYKKYNITNPILHNKHIIKNLNIEDFEELINTDKQLFIDILSISNILTTNDSIQFYNDEYYISDYILTNNCLKNYIKYTKKYDLKDKFLLNMPIIAISNNQYAEKFFELYDANLKRLLKKSNVITMNNDKSAIENLSSLFNFINILGGFEKDSNTRQRVYNFITEKIFEEYLPNGEENKYRIIGDDLYRVFSSLVVREIFDKDFAVFFMDYYKDIIEFEKEHSGFIQRVYLNFPQITESYTSNKGSQRNLKMTFEKTISYFDENLFSDKLKGDKLYLAKFLYPWFDTEETIDKAWDLYCESLYACRNIFIDNNSPKFDLKEKKKKNDFYFEWLPKQSFENLLLGKYCNCCAHIEGSGNGITRASMVLNNCQNLVIRNSDNKIIAKATLYINKEEGYGVFNNLEASLKYRNKTELLKIYKALLRGTKAFIKTYNENNNDKIYEITMGNNRNAIYEQLNKYHSDSIIKESLNFGEYALNGFGYNGDWQCNQKTLIKLK